MTEGGRAFEVVATRGSAWHRWDPHIHTPGTTLNDQYKGPDPWDEFLTKIEKSDPPIRALGITDYCSIDNYIKTVKWQRKGRIPGVGLIFPNVELRLSIETHKAAAINIHLLFSPHEPDHIERIRRFLDGLEFRYQGDVFRCNESDLTRLGRIHNPSLSDDRAALREGTNQFKVDFEQLRKAWTDNLWVQENAVVAVAGGSRDGTSGLQDDKGAFAALRKNIEQFAHIIFSSSPQQIAFYLGKGTATLDELEKKWGGRKPCLHGSDAHESERVGAPDMTRRSWLKGDLTFETVRFAVIEPEGRVHVGEFPPRGALPGSCMRTVEVSNAPWMIPSRVPINPGMVAIIGARGSGKTALADLVAMGAFGVLSQLSESSFLRRAAEYLTDASVTLAWEAGQETSNTVSAVEAEDLLDAPHVQYLSQKFVERLCSSEGLNDALVSEVQRVIFQAHSEVDRLGAQDFGELLALRLEASREARNRQKQALERATDAITTEQIRKDGLKGQIKERDDKKKAIDKDKADRKLLIGKGQEQRVKRLEVISAALEEKQRIVRDAKLRLKALEGLRGDVQDFEQRLVPDWLADLKERRADAGLTEDDWKAFGVKFAGDIESVLQAHVQATSKHLKTYEGPAAADPPLDSAADPNIALIPEDANLEAQTLHLLERERDRMQRLIGVDQQNARRIKALSEKIAKDEAALVKINAEIERAQKADVTLAQLREARTQAYQGIFDAVISEEKELQALYAPLKERILKGQGALSKMSFSVRRIVNLDSWAEQGEELLDLRRSGPFQGAGELRRVAEKTLGVAWEQGSAEEAAKAMSRFITEYGESLKKHMPGQANFREWAAKVSRWLYSTDHIQVGYGLQYDGVEIESLSPGTRGIVLLLLYLAIDSEDERPLIIDQPEENLDPQSVFDELVPVFREAKQRRQIIIVTHNANLVVNTDVDQVIVARCGPHRPRQLPEITYQCGGLENRDIRAAVCAVLEGGERAFRERARRLRLTLSTR